MFSHPSLPELPIKRACLTAAFFNPAATTGTVVLILGVSREIGGNLCVQVLIRVERERMSSVLSLGSFPSAECMLRAFNWLLAGESSGD